MGGEVELLSRGENDLVTVYSVVLHSFEEL